MFFAEDLTWNVRDTHMTDTATHLNEYLSTQRKIQRPKIAICASSRASHELGLTVHLRLMHSHAYFWIPDSGPGGPRAAIRLPTAPFQAPAPCCHPLSTARQLRHTACDGLHAVNAPQGRTTATWATRATRAWGAAGARSTWASCCARSEWLRLKRLKCMSVAAEVS